MLDFFYIYIIYDTFLNGYVIDIRYIITITIDNSNKWIRQVFIK